MLVAEAISTVGAGIPISSASCIMANAADGQLQAHGHSFGEGGLAIGLSLRLAAVDVGGRDTCDVLSMCLRETYLWVTNLGTVKRCRRNVVGL